MLKRLLVLLWFAPPCAALISWLDSRSPICTRGVPDAATRARNDVSTLRSAVETYRGWHDHLPESLDLLIRPDTVLGGETYLSQVVLSLDPWNHAYLFERLDANRFRVLSAGPDGVAGTEDDVEAKALGGR